MAMAARKKKPAASKKKKTESSKPRIRSALNQVKEPLSLLSTLRDEGMANASYWLQMASQAASSAADISRQVGFSRLKPQARELLAQTGFALREDVERLEARLEELEGKVSDLEMRAMGREPRDEDE
jgi:multidrug resistance efflux pump